MRRLIRQIKKVTTCTAAALVTAASAFAADTPPIRQFDIPTIETLGAAMYAQDQEAWKATDVLNAKVAKEQLKADKLHGWIVESFTDRDVVRFIRDDGTDGPEAYYDVVFLKTGGEPTLTAPDSRVLNADEAAQYSARVLALKNSELNCSDTYNTVELKDPERDGWLVWVMAATKDPDLIIIGGHYRFTISADGKTIQQRDALSRSCLRFSRKDRSGSTGLLMSHVVSTTPIETHVFASLSYRIGFYVGTPDGRAWNVGEGHITEIQQDAASLDGFAARALEGNEENCVAIVTKAGDAGHKFYNVPVKGVINGTEQTEKFAPQLPAGDTATSILCVRQDLVPAPNDYKVLLAGMPLFIADKGQGHPERTGVLELAGGRIQFQTINGDPPTTSLLDRLQKRLDVLQNSVNRIAQNTNSAH